MKIQVNTDSQTEATAVLTKQVQILVEDKLGRFADRITRVEVHLTDENSHGKSGGSDKRCLIEVRLAGMQPITVSDHDASHDQALRGAATKMRSMLESTLGKREAH